MAEKKTTRTASESSAKPARRAAKTARPRKAAGTGAKTFARRAAPHATAVDAEGKNLIIVESPAKARTIERYLGSDYKVIASIGHVIDLPLSKLGVDVENDFHPDYEVIKGKKSVLDALRKSAKGARAVYLAPDPDREGEAIAYHISEWIKDSNDNIQRATFNEITKSAVREAIEHPRGLDMNLFYAQQARRVLDRLVGYKLSPLLWRKVRRGLSAGRVQSVAVRIICEREREIQAFTPVEYWTIEGLAAAGQPPAFKVRLAKIDDKKAEIPNKDAADAILAEIDGKPFVISDVVKKEQARRPFAPFITSTLQQEASRRLRFTAKQTMAMAQQLYEGIDLGGERGSVGLITYMRTDSTRLSDYATNQVRDYISANWPAEYLPERGRVYATGKGAQDAHEAIRPTDISLTPEMIAPYIEDKRMLELYRLIWLRTVACQMNDARLERTRVEIPVGRYLFTANGSVVKFDGFLRVYQESRDELGRSESDSAPAEEKNGNGNGNGATEEEGILPPLEKGQSVSVSDLKGDQHFTLPPPRFTEAGLIKELEKQGIGRPSTYAAIISTIQDKEYTTKEAGTFRPTELGFITTDLLTESFPKVLDVTFTAEMERELDQVEDGSADWVKVLRDFYGPFEESLKEAAKSMRNVKAEAQPTDIVCEKCGRPMVVKWGRMGKFIACSGFPECRNTKPIVEDAEGNVRAAEVETTDRKCPNCGRPMVVKNGRMGRFLACSGYPECKTAQPYPIGVPCPEQGCTGEIVERRNKRGKTFYGCNRYPECKFTASMRPYREQCAECGKMRTVVGEGENKKVLCRELDQCIHDKARS
ncbi:type I DNA topoisomerase [bacterium]|nr:type I DNA topoisomerase [bacterium]